MNYLEISYPPDVCINMIRIYDSLKSAQIIMIS